MNHFEYWIGEGINSERIWDNYDKGQAYIEKFKSTETYMLCLKFNASSNLPLFNHEAVYKTIKSLFHDLKKECLPDSEYNKLGPIYLYEIKRGSAEWKFVAELKPLILLSLILLPKVAKWIQDYKNTCLDNENKSLDNLEKRLSIIKRHFPRAGNIDTKQFIKARTDTDRTNIINKLLDQGLVGIEISKTPIGSVEPPKDFIDIKEITED
ncbi:MAG: hypothetical protein A2231_11485 [Candidatus Firestonebacteria bacterium RIFOXYA2_FULL_40_8]|nr:MAG: hypothetical protein A2231_11485 [Candidatus Firestonebacteria bacterium RIFOXYA2_FULL_40_8]